MKITKTLFRLTDIAMEEFDWVREELNVPKNFKLQIIIKKGGDPRVDFSFKFKESPDRDEMTYIHKGFEYIVDTYSAIRLAGSTLDFKRDEFVLDAPYEIDYHIVGEA